MCKSGRKKVDKIETGHFQEEIFYSVIDDIHVDKIYQYEEIWCHQLSKLPRSYLTGLLRIGHPEVLRLLIFIIHQFNLLFLVRSKTNQFFSIFWSSPLFKFTNLFQLFFFQTMIYCLQSFIHFSNRNSINIFQFRIS